MPQLILVDKNDNQIGTMEKLEAHQKGLLHRCFSIFIFNSSGQLMLQKRASHKYHSGGLWTNTCCSHPEPNTELIPFAQKRLQEEMGFRCDLKEILAFTYKKTFDNGLTEHEFDHVLVGYYDKDPSPNPQEADDWKWVTADFVSNDMQKNPDSYTYWFTVAWPMVLKFLKSTNNF